MSINMEILSYKPIRRRLFKYYDLSEELVKNLGCRYVDARRVFKNIAVHIQSKCIQVINKNHGYKILESIMEERSLSYDRLHDINIRIRF